MAEVAALLHNLQQQQSDVVLRSWSSVGREENGRLVENQEGVSISLRPKDLFKGFRPILPLTSL